MRLISIMNDAVNDAGVVEDFSRRIVVKYMTVVVGQVPT